MVQALLTTTLLSLVCFLATAVTGFTRHGGPLHFLLGVFATLLVTLAQSMTMFYFIGTGKQVKDLVAERPVPNGNEFIRRTKVFKAKVFPTALWAMLFTMATMILGGGVDTHVIPVWVHTVLATASLYFNLKALWLDAKYMLEDNLLREELAGVLQTTSVSE